MGAKEDSARVATLAGPRGGPLFLTRAHLQASLMIRRTKREQKKSPTSPSFLWSDETMGVSNRQSKLLFFLSAASLRLCLHSFLIGPRGVAGFSGAAFKKGVRYSPDVALHEKKSVRRGGGGRAPQQPDQMSAEESESTLEPSPAAPSEARLIILQITDVYTLEYFASFKTLLEEIKEKSKGAKVICMLTGDFLSPYLLSSVDRGAGMMRALGNIPMDYLTVSSVRTKS
jgi:hypothetical protein